MYQNQARSLAIFITLLISLIALVASGQVFAQVKNEDKVVLDTIYQNSAYIQQDDASTNSDLLGAWTPDYKYYWLADPADSKFSLPSFVKNVSYRGVIQQTSSVGLSTPETLGLDEKKRNKYYLTSSLNGEPIEISLDLEHNSQFAEWLPLSLYFDPFVANYPKQQIRVRLSYARSSLGDIVYIQDTKFNTGHYLNLLVKAPTQGELGRLTIEIKPENNSTKPAISGIFWDDKRNENTFQLTYTGINQISAPIWHQNQRTFVRSIIWSPQSQEVNNFDDIVNISLGKVTYATSNGFEFPLSTRQKTYNFEVLKGEAGPEGFGGLELYLRINQEISTNGCNLGLYFTEDYKQNIFIYSAFEDKENKLLTMIETKGDGLPSFETFHIPQFNSNIVLRIRLTTNNESIEPTLRGLYITKAVSAFEEEPTPDIQNDIPSIVPSGSQLEQEQQLTELSASTTDANPTPVPLATPSYVVADPRLFNTALPTPPPFINPHDYHNNSGNVIETDEHYIDISQFPIPQAPFPPSSKEHESSSETTTDIPEVNFSLDLPDDNDYMDTSPFPTPPADPRFSNAPLPTPPPSINQHDYNSNVTENNDHYTNISQPSMPPVNPKGNSNEWYANDEQALIPPPPVDISINQPTDNSNKNQGDNEHKGHEQPPHVIKFPDVPVDEPDDSDSQGATEIESPTFSINLPNEEIVPTFGEPPQILISQPIPQQAFPNAILPFNPNHQGPKKDK